MKKIASLVLVAVVMFAGMLPLGAIPAFAAGGQYIDADGVARNIPEATEITSDTEILGAGWYTVSNSVEIDHRIYMLGGAVHIILMDSAELTVHGALTLLNANTSLTIYGQSGGTGSLTVDSVAGNCAGIGSGDVDTCGDITINGGIITVTGGENSAGIGSGKDCTCGNITINGGTVTATGGNEGVGIGSGHTAKCGNITINGGCIKSKGIGAGTNASCGSVTYFPSCTREELNGWCCVNIGYVDAVEFNCTEDGHIAYYADLWHGLYYTDFSFTDDVLIGNGKALAEWLAPGGEGFTGAHTGHAYNDVGKRCDNCGGYFFYDYVSGEMTEGIHAAAVIDSSTDELTDGWYIVSDNVEITGNLKVTRDVHLILADDASLTVNGTVAVENGNSLTIYSQSFGEHMGSLSATGATYNAGIGGIYDDSGTIVINGGNIKARGGNGGAGIGGGFFGNSGTISIHNGNVWAKGGRNVPMQPSMGAPGIGGGENGGGGTVEITGGRAEFYGGGLNVIAINTADIRLGVVMAAYVINNGEVTSGELSLKEKLIHEATGILVELRGEAITGSVLSEGSLWIVIAIPVLAVVGVAALVIVKKKKKKPELADE